MWLLHVRGVRLVWTQTKAQPLQPMHKQSLIAYGQSSELSNAVHKQSLTAYSQTQLDASHRTGNSSPQPRTVGMPSLTVICKPDTDAQAAERRLHLRRRLLVCACALGCLSVHACAHVPQTLATSSVFASSGKIFEPERQAHT
jgi:hypothetical protein